MSKINVSQMLIEKMETLNFGRSLMSVKENFTCCAKEKWGMGGIFGKRLTPGCIIFVCIQMPRLRFF